ncbi:PAS domain S-box-containing protein [Sphingomonas zeicaulis]|uniref:PAS domain-containing protein n=1 Tax=Sphingomonas zeicaulis TaxID=1632740 RepID=UPI003D1B1057
MPVGTGPVGQCLADENKTIIWIDDALLEMLGRERDEVVGRDALDFTFAPDRAPNLDLLKQLVDDDRPFAITKRYIGPSGHAFWVNNHVSSVRDGAGPRRLLATSRHLEPTSQTRIDGQMLAAAKRLAAALQDSGSDECAYLASSAPLEMMVLLYIANAETDAHTVASIAEDVRLPFSTVERWMRHLRSRALVEFDDEGPLRGDNGIRISRRGGDALESLLLKLATPA